MAREYKFFVYILTNPSQHPLYPGFTNSASRRYSEHKERQSDYTSR